jgi:hypothetical protein
LSCPGHANGPTLPLAAFAAIGGVPNEILYDHKTAIIGEAGGSVAPSADRLRRQPLSELHKQF